GPDCQNLAFNLANGSSSPWNVRVLDLLLEDLKERSEKEVWVVRRSDGYYRETLEHRYKRLQTIWREGQVKVTAKGTLETGEDVEKRLITQRDKTLKLVRQATRRQNICLQSQSRSNTDDLPTWEWLQKLIKTLGDDGMSSEESDVENNVEMVLWVKNMSWRHEVERELNIIDHQRVFDDEIF
ncbi:hypothetical protein P692DRAFT_201684653, partial [Suillus brevipes Sb2]